MIFVSIIRLRIRLIRFLPGLASQTLTTLRQCGEADGSPGRSLPPDRRLTFWAMTLWRDQAATRTYRASGDHLTAMQKLPNWRDEASVLRRSQDDE